MLEPQLGAVHQHGLVLDAFPTHHDARVAQGEQATRGVNVLARRLAVHAKGAHTTPLQLVHEALVQGTQRKTGLDQPRSRIGQVLQPPAGERVERGRSHAEAKRDGKTGKGEVRGGVLRGFAILGPFARSLQIAGDLTHAIAMIEDGGGQIDLHKGVRTELGPVEPQGASHEGDREPGEGVGPKARGRHGRALRFARDAGRVAPTSEKAITERFVAWHGHGRLGEKQRISLSEHGIHGFIEQRRVSCR